MFDRVQGLLFDGAAQAVCTCTFGERASSQDTLCSLFNLISRPAAPRLSALSVLLWTPNTGHLRSVADLASARIFRSRIIDPNAHGPRFSEV